MGVANIKEIAEAGADFFVAGSAILKNPRTQDVRALIPCIPSPFVAWGVYCVVLWYAVFILRVNASFFLRRRGGLAVCVCVVLLLGWVDRWVNGCLRLPFHGSPHLYIVG